ncbi:MAG: hypothetical protein ACRDTU_14425 [Micromonosporaceae bacterium]
MEIDSQVEPLVREALDAAVKKDADRLGTALTAFADEDMWRRGLELTVAIGTVALLDMYDGGPSAEELPEGARAISDMEAWAGLSSDEVRGYLTALANREPLDDKLHPERAVLLVFVVTGSLLSSSPKKREGEWWYQYLDRVEATIAAG